MQEELEKDASSQELQPQSLSSNETKIKQTN